MPSHRLLINVPTPCHEDWSAMTPETQGRFCQSCAKTVTDFTTMTDAEVVNWLSKQKGNSCGRFRASQLDKILVSVSQVKKPLRWQAFALGLSAWLSAKTVDAKPPSPSLKLEQATIDNVPEEISALTEGRKSDTTIVLKGVVVDKQDKMAIPGATVHLKGTATAVPSTIDGNFELTITTSKPIEEAIIIFSFIGYVDQEVPLAKLLKQDAPAILMEPDVKGEMEVMVVGGAWGYKWYSPRGLFYSAKNFFGYTIPNLFTRN